MAEIHELAIQMKELDDQLVSCMRCGMCQAVCPVFGETGLESDVTRGKLALLDGLAKEILDDPESVNQKLNKCLLCGTCASNCPSGVHVMDIFLKARSIITGYKGLPPAKKAIFRGLLAHPELFGLVAKIGSRFQGIFTKNVDEMIGSSCARFNFPGIGGRHFKTLDKMPLSQEIKSLDTRAGKSGVRVAFFIGCAIDKIFPSVGRAALKVLKHHGVGIYMPRGQACCGIPVLASGDSDTFQHLIRKNLKLFGKGEFDYLLTSCATCTATIKETWKTMYYGEDWEMDRLEMLAAKTMDINAFLVDVLGVEPAAEARANGKKVTYHDPCHLRNALKVTKQPRAVARANPAYNFVEMNEAASCCGCGGSFSIEHYEVTASIGSRKAQNVVDSGAEIVATGCPACMIQLTDMLSQKGAKIPVKHVVELYAESL